MVRKDQNRNLGRQENNKGPDQAERFEAAWGVGVEMKGGCKECVVCTMCVDVCDQMHKQKQRPEAANVCQLHGSKKWLSNAFICAGAKLFQMFSNIHCGEELSGTVKCKKAISIILYNSLKWKPFFFEN